MIGQQPSLIIQLKGHKESIMALDLHPKCRYAVSAGQDYVFNLWDLKEQSPPQKFEGHKGYLQDIKFNPNGITLASTSSDGAIKFWEVENQTKQVTLTKAHNAKIRSINYSCDGNLLVSSGDDKLVKIWSTIDRRLQATYKKHDNWVRYSEFSPIAKSLVSCDDKFVYIWDVQTKKAIQQYKAHSGVIHQSKFHSLGNIVASCSHDKKVKLYDLRSRDVIQVYEGHKAAIKTIDFHPHTSHLISSSEDGQTKIWNTQKGRLEYTLHDTPSNITRFSFEGDYFITAGSDKTVNLWKTGFYDSFKQKLPENQALKNKSKKRVECEVKQSGERVVTQESNHNNKRPEEVQRTRNGDNIVYCHEKENFELIGNLPKERQEPKQIIPHRLLSKLNQISNQLAFISKTTQILQARVINNGQQLQRLRSMAELGYSDSPSIQ